MNLQNNAISAYEMRKHTKEQINKNIDDFYSSILDEVKQAADDGHFEVTREFVSNYDKIPWKDGKSGLEYVREKLDTLGYEVSTASSLKIHKNGCYYIEDDGKNETKAIIHISWSSEGD